MQEIIDFLKRNGFELMDESEPFHYANDKCSVVIENSRNYIMAYFAIANNNGDVMYSNSINIYWLIGYLLHAGYIDNVKL